MQANLSPKTSAVFIASLPEARAYLFRLIRERNTERQQQFKRQQENLESSLRAAHDIKSPLSALLILSESISQMPTQHQNVMQMAISRNQSIADEIMHKDLGSEAPTGSDRTPERTELTALLNGLVAQKRAELRQRRDFEIHVLGLDDGSQRWCRGNTSDLQRAISNILNNAVEAIKRERRVVIIVQRHSLNWKISIQDSGPGIPNEIKDKLFSRGATFGKAGGNGLGLWQTKAAIEEAGGTVALERVLPMGTCAKITLPAV